MWWTRALVLVTAVGVILSTVQAASVSSKRYIPEWYTGVKVGTVTSHSIPEASGICASRVHHNVLYTHNDSGDTHRIFAISTDTGQRLATITINGAHSHDWEDIACSRCTSGSGHCIYIADTGGNAGGYASNTIYRIREPSSVNHDITVNLDGTLKFSWDQHDCESLMADPNGELYVISKVHHGGGKVVHLPGSAWDTGHHMPVSGGVHLQLYTNSWDPVAADISLNGQEVLVKTYGHIYYYYVQNGDIYSALQQPHPTSVRYVTERQGEGICFDAQGAGFYTLGELRNAPLYYYRLKSSHHR